MQPLPWLLIGWALGLLSGVIAALLVYSLSRRWVGSSTSAASTGWNAPRLLLLVSVPLAIAVLVAASVLLGIDASQAREEMAREVARTQAAETFQHSQETASAKADERKLTATAAAQSTAQGQVASPTPFVVTATAPQASPTPTGASSTPAPPTDTPAPATSTPRPTRRPTRTATPRTVSKSAGTPQPTVTPPSQYAWRGEIAGSAANCKKTQLEGFALNRDGGLAGNIWIHYWSENWSGAWARSTSEGQVGEPGEGVGRNWDGFLVPYPRSGTWKVCVVPGDVQVQCISNELTVTTTEAPCNPGSEGVQIVRIVFQQN